MPPHASEPRPPVIIGYYDASTDRRARRGRLLRILAGVLAVAALASAANAWWNHWGLNFVCFTAVAAAAGLALRAGGGRLLIAFRSAWLLAAAVFGLWALIIFTNQFHGRPPASEIYFVGCWAVACALSMLGLSFDTRRSEAE